MRHLGEDFNFSIDESNMLNIQVPTFTDIVKISLGTEYYGDVYVDNITIHSPDAQGHAITPTVTLPFNRWWDWVEISKSQNLYGRAKFSVLMPYANHVFPKHENITTNSDIIDDIFMDDTDKLYLEFWMTGENGYYPRVDWWKIYWRPDPPTQSRDIPDIHLQEDKPQQDILNLTDYFSDWYIPDRNFTFGAIHSSDWSHVRPVIHGQNLSVELPTRDWYGSETIRVNCSDGEFNVTSRNITVVVAPVNDPPVIVSLGAFDITEGNLTELNLTPFISDVDTPVEDLAVRTDCANCTVLGQNLTFFYDVGDVTEEVAIYVSDGELEVGAVLEVYIINVNDPPVIGTIPRQTATEESPFVFDVRPFLSDEDDPAGELIVTCDHPNVVSIEGQSITILFPEYVEPQTVGIHVSDGKTTLPGWFEVEVVPVNDPPVLRSIGGRPVSGMFSIEIDEGEVLILALEITDVDSPSPRIYVDSNLAGFELLANGSLRMAPARGVIGDFWATITVDDLDGGIVETNLTISVANVNDPPAVPRILSPANGAIFDEGTNITFNVEFSDPDTVLGQVLTIVWSSDVSGILLAFTSENARSFTRNNLTSGSHMIMVSVYDGQEERSASLVIEVKAKEIPPIDGEDDEDGGEGFPVLMIGIVIAVIAVLIGAMLYVRSRK